jgi:hypothetical protein
MGGLAAPRETGFHPGRTRGKLAMNLVNPVNKVREPRSAAPHKKSAPESHAMAGRSLPNLQTTGDRSIAPFLAARKRGPSRCRRPRRSRFPMSN